MQYTSNQHKSSQDFTYINMRGPSASYLAVSAISNIPLRVGRDFAQSGLLLNPTMINTRIQQKSVPIITYIHLKGPSASLLAL